MQDFPLPHNLRASTDLREVVQHGELVLVVIPTPFVERTMRQVSDVLQENQIIVR